MIRAATCTFREALPEYRPVIWPKLALVTVVFGFAKNGEFRKLKAWPSSRNFTRSVIGVSLCRSTCQMPMPGPRKLAKALERCCTVNEGCTANWVVSNHWSTVCGLALEVLIRSAPENARACPDVYVPVQLSCQPPTTRLTNGFVVARNLFPGPKGNSYSPDTLKSDGRSLPEITLSGAASSRL